MAKQTSRQISKKKLQKKTSQKEKVNPVKEEETYSQSLMDHTDGALEKRIGTILRQHRQRSHLTLAEMADGTGISAAMLSRIETGRASASIEVLTRYAAALGVALSSIFRQLELPSGEAQFVKNGEGMEVVRVGTKQAGYTYKILGYNQGPDKVFEPFLIEMDENSRGHASFEHSGTEFIHMLKGKMEYRYGQDLYLLEPGDSLTFSSEVEHGPERLLSKQIQFLAIVIYEPGGIH
jgi:transcriptional regulator with XRE-family HTH domain